MFAIVILAMRHLLRVRIPPLQILELRIRSRDVDDRADSYAFDLNSTYVVDVDVATRADSDVEQLKNSRPHDALANTGTVTSLQPGDAGRRRAQRNERRGLGARVRRRVKGRARDGAGEAAFAAPRHYRRRARATECHSMREGRSAQNRRVCSNAVLVRSCVCVAAARNQTRRAAPAEQRPRGSEASPICVAP